MCVVISYIFEMFIVEAIQNWLVAIWMINYLEIDHWWLLSGVVPMLSIWVELLSKLNSRPLTGMHWFMNAPFSCVIVFVFNELWGVWTWRPWHHSRPHDCCRLRTSLIFMALLF